MLLVGASFFASVFAACASGAARNGAGAPGVTAEGPATGGIGAPPPPAPPPPTVTPEMPAAAGNACSTDSDCVPASCCHPTTCVSRAQAPSCSGVMCTENCAPATLDCGGSCLCQQGRCVGQRRRGG